MINVKFNIYLYQSHEQQEHDKSFDLSKDSLPSLKANPAIISEPIASIPPKPVNS